MEKCIPAGGAVAEGVRNSVSVHELADRYNIGMPISNAVYQILHEGISCSIALDKLLERDPLNEEMMCFQI